MTRPVRFGKKTYQRVYPIVLASFLVALCVFFALYQGFQSALFCSVNTLNEDFIKQVNSTASSAESVLQNFCAQMFNMRSVTKMRTYLDLSNADMIDGIRALNDFTASSTVVDSIYVYNGKQDYIYSTVAYGAVSDYARLFKDTGAVALFRGRAAGQQLMPIGRDSAVSTNSANRHLFSIMMFEVNAGGEISDNALMLNISSDWFSELYFGGDRDNAAFIMDEAGALISRSAGMDEAACARLIPETLSRLQGGTESGYFTNRKENGDEQLCFFARMGARGWYYVRAVPYEKYISGLMQMQQNAYTFFGAAFLVVLVSALILAVRVYVPFRHMRDSLSVLESGDVRRADPIEQLNALIERSTDSTRINNALRGMLRDEALRGLLLGQEGAGVPRADEYELRLADGVPVVPVLVSTTRVEQLLETVRPHCPRSEGVVVQGEHTVLLLQPERADDIPALCERLLSRSPTRRAIAGNAEADWRALAKAYDTLLEAYRLRFLHPGERVRFTVTNEQLEDSSLAAEQQIDPITDSLKNANRAALAEHYERFLAALQGKTYRSVTFALTHMARSVLRLYYELFPDALPLYKEARAAFDELLLSLDDIATLNAYFEERYTHIIEKIRHDRRSRQDDAMEGILRTIQTDYTDATLNSQYLADRFGMSSAYLCRVFRQSQGVSLPDYIGSLRMEEAKRLLRETDIKIKEIGPRVGVENVQYFFVLFKQATGETPRQYRARMETAG